MASKYPRSLRGCLPLWTLLLQAALIVIFFFFASYDSFIQYPEVVTQGAILQDMVVMAALGLGFLSSSLWRYSWSSVAFNLFMLALGVQWAVLLDGFLEHPRLGKVFIELSRIQQATMTAMSVLISAGAILGKANLAQLVLLVLMEVTAFSATRMISQQFLSVCFNRVLGIHDTCGVHYTFGLPGLLGGITYIAYLTSWFKDPLIAFQMLYDIAALSLSLAMGLASGLLTGVILNLKIWKAPHVVKYFDDQAFWEFPHLAVGF
uniref:Ammonium transporter AmtB-like domain-containing protein n=1 Tax=Pipistrellus kuhlii TaxID=59472 RepID=A0A7J8A8F0_PIPKU|nr:hypothetical protein mPipKuh1_009042 [Pipistrellus kuhlii]